MKKPLVTLNRYPQRPKRTNMPEVELDDMLQGWEDEVFEDFVRADDTPENDDSPVASLATDDALKDALAQLKQGSENQVPVTAETHDAFADQSNEAEAFSQESVDAPTKPAKATLPAMGRISSVELAEAFLDDAARGLASLDQAVLDFETNHNRTEALGIIGRELHTLKGASAIVGLTDMSRYLHDIEELVQAPSQDSRAITDSLLECISTIRQQASTLQNQHDPAQAGPNQSLASSEPKLESISVDKGAISVKSKQLDRLLDMVTALTMLNNQRDSYVEQLRSVNANLNQCGNRLRDLDRMVSTSTDQPMDSLRSMSNPLRELGNDISEISKILRDAYSPIAQEHLATSNFIRQFRQALISILRTPISGLFRRLQRSVLDAARVEQKQVRLEITGSEVGLERSVQEQLLDPLMHIVRNAVSHGIERPDERKQCGKDPVGTVTLEAVSSPNQLTLVVRDDGAGLDYEALRKKGTELGLLDDGEAASEQELGQLIFRRGFSTREEANEIAGRGIGMDVVVDALERMQAWIEVDSVTHKGTQIRLNVPLRSITEHVLVVRVGEYLAAIPMQFVGSANDLLEHDTLPELASVLGTPLSGSKTTVSIECTQSRVKTEDERSHAVFCTVDEILGPQEVVVRPLPPLLQNNSVLSGVTLSATGDVMYVLNARAVSHQLSSLSKDGETEQTGSAASQSVRTPETPRLLVVDDSLSARIAVSLHCRELGWEVVEAPDGLAALELINEGDWSAVVTDFDMPHLDGIKFIEALREKSFMSDVPVLMASSRPVEEMHDKAIAAGATYYVQKPLTSESIDELITSKRGTEKDG